MYRERLLEGNVFDLIEFYFYFVAEFYWIKKCFIALEDDIALF